jgi:TolB-like protein
MLGGHSETLLQLGRGQLLDGMTLPGAAGFERWLEEERRDLQRTLVLALDRMADAATDAGRCVELRRRRVELDPLDAMGAMALMRALAAAGDRPSAIQHARVYGELVRQELELDPDPRVVQLAVELQDTRLVHSVAAVQREIAGAAPATPPVALRETLTAALREMRRRTRQASRRVPWRLVRQASAVAVSGVAVLLALAHYGTEHIIPQTPPPRVAVLPFATVGATPDLDFLRTGMVDLLGYALAERDTLPMVGAEEVTARWPTTPTAPSVDSLRVVAASLGADRLVTGTIVGTAQRLVLRAQLHDTRATTLGTVTVSGPLDSLAPMVRRAATQLVAAAHGSLASVGPRELAPRVLRAWMDGRDAYRRGRWTDARRAFASALAADSTFHVAAVHLALAADWLDDVVTREQALQHLAERVADLPATERAITLALRPPRHPVPPSAEEFFTGWEEVARGGERAEWWVEVGRRYLADGVAAGIEDARGRAAKALARAWAMDSTDPAVTTILAAAPDASDANTTEPVLVARWREALRAGNAESLARLRATLGETADGEVRAVAVALLRDGGYPADLERLVDHRTNAALGSWARQDAAASAHATALDRGDAARVREAVARLDQLTSFGAGERLAILDAMYGGADTAGIAAVVTMVEARLRAPLTSTDQRREAVADRCVTEQWRAWGRQPAAPGGLAQLQRDTLGPGTLAAAASGPACAALVAAIRERTAARAPRVALQGAEHLALAGPVAGDLRQYATLALARVRHELGQHDAAWRLVQRRPAGRGWPRYLAAYDHLEGVIAAERADSAAARSALRRYLARRTDADSAFGRDLDQARRQLERLAPEP